MPDDMIGEARSSSAWPWPPGTGFGGRTRGRRSPGNRPAPARRRWLPAALAGDTW